MYTIHIHILTRGVQKIIKQLPIILEKFKIQISKITVSARMSHLQIIFRLALLPVDISTTRTTYSISCRRRKIGIARLHRKLTFIPKTLSFLGVMTLLALNLEDPYVAFTSASRAYFIRFFRIMICGNT